MEILSEEPRRTSWLSAALALILHQGIVYLCAFVLAPSAAYIFTGWVHLFGWTITVHQLGGVLMGLPYFPVHVGLALVLGWSLGAWLQHRSMEWVWIIPFLVLSYEIVTFSPLKPLGFKPDWYLSSPSRVSRFFGWGCRPENRCLEQLIFTMPFYGALAYSVGAYLARVKMHALSGYTEAMNRIRMQRALLVGAAVLGCDLIGGWRLLAGTVRQGGWLGVAGVLWAGVSELALVTYATMVVISLIGRQFFVGRWFLSPTTAAGKASSPDLQAQPEP
jgi:hypothetical protein